uniref:AAA+ ATPase domain-containing protein n=1 Tax=viral metagenome TaxID=1070528 RepID=A0A6C0J7C5_9ZZZZ
MDDNLWYERHRPKSLGDIIISSRKKIAVNEWFAKFKGGNIAQCAMLFIGPPGLGKTSLAQAILHDNGYTVKEFNASDIRSKSQITENLNGLINMTNVTSIGFGHKKKPTAIIMDEVDGMFKGDRGGVDALLSFISIPSNRKKKTLNNNNRNVPVICICNIGNVKKETINNLKKECFTIEFTLPTANDMMTVLDRVTSAENMNIKDDAKNIIIDYAQTDFRRLVCLLEFIDNYHGKVMITQGHLEKCFSIMCLKEQDLYVTDAVKKMINQKLDPYQIQSIYNCDKSKTPMVIHQNYHRAISGQRCDVMEKIKDAITIIDSLIISDEVEKIMYNTQNWGLQPVQSLTCAHIPSYYMNKRKKQHVIDTKWAAILSVNSQAQNLWKNVYQELDQMHHDKTYNICDLQHIIEVIFHYIINGNIKEAMMKIAHYDLCLDLHDHDRKKYKRKKALTIIDKMAKYIKTSSYYTKWAGFLCTNKNNKELDDKIYGYYIQYERTLKSNIQKNVISPLSTALLSDEHNSNAIDVVKNNIKVTNVDKVTKVDKVDKVITKGNKISNIKVHNISNIKVHKISNIKHEAKTISQQKQRIMNRKVTKVFKVVKKAEG